MEQSKKEIQNLKQPADKRNVSNSDTAVSKKKTQSCRSSGTHAASFSKKRVRKFSATRDSGIVAILCFAASRHKSHCT